MPASYGISPGPTPEMIAWSTVRDRLLNERNYWIATTRPGGRPHTMPVWGIWQDDMLYFATDPASRKSRNLVANSSAIVHLESGDNVVILEGIAKEVRDATVLGHFAEAYEVKYGFRPDTTGISSSVYCFRPEFSYAWRETDFPRSATRWSFGEG